MITLNKPKQIDGKYENNFTKVSAKQFAIDIIEGILLNVDYWDEKYPEEYKQMTGKEIAEVVRQLTNMDIRIRKMLNKAKGV